MASRYECRVRHLTVSMHVRRKRDRLLDLPRFLTLIEADPKSRDPLPIDGRHVLRLEDIQIEPARGIASLLISCSDKDGRDATYTDWGTFARRRFRKKATEGIGSSAHLVISLDHDPHKPMLHPALLEESEGLHRARIEHFINSLAAACVPGALSVPALGGGQNGKKEETARFRMDVYNDRALKELADEVKLREVVVVGAGEPDPEFHMTEQPVVRFRVDGTAGIDSAKQVISRAWQKSKQRIPGLRHMSVHLERADGHGATLRVDSEKDDALAEAFQKIDTLKDFAKPLEDAPEKFVPELVARMRGTLLTRVGKCSQASEVANPADAHEEPQAALQPA